MTNTTTKNPMQASLMNIISEYEPIAADWNGEDSTYMSGGDIFTEDHAHVANDITEKARELIDLISEFQNV